MSAVHVAITAIRAGECDAAIVGGLNLTLRPEYSVNVNKLGALAQDGKCKAFDITADGYVRAEATVAIYLQKSKDARRMYATVIHTKTNTDGYKPQGISYPNSEMQNQLLRETYVQAGINPADVVYLEAHGTGTSVGDPQEVNSIDKLFCKNRTTPLLIGSVKSNIGHTEAASGLCSIAKVLIAMETGVIPANLHFSIPNSKIAALSEGRLRVIDKNTRWNGGLVAINSFGFGGANAHIILRSNPKEKLLSTLDMVDTLPKLITVSGCTEEAVHVLLNKASEHRKDTEFISLLHTIHNSSISGHRYRGYEVLSHDKTRQVSQQTKYDEERPIWFVFSGMGTQWAGMGRDIMNIDICKRSLQQCADILMPHGVDLINTITISVNETYEDVVNSFVSIVAIQIALVDILSLIGVHANGIIGHSIGELGCAYADGALTMEQTILTAYYRGKAIIDSELEPGAMAAIGLSCAEAEKICPPDIYVACRNSVDSVTVSGPPGSLRAFIENLKSKDIFAKMVDSSGIAFHSKYMRPIESKLRAFLEHIIPNPIARSSKWISTSVPEASWDSPSARLSSTEYYVNNVLSPVLFQEAIAHIPENAITIEIAPHSLLQAILRRSLPVTVTNIGLQKRNEPNNMVYLLSSVGKLYMAGAQSNISKLYSPVSFPVSRGTPMIGSFVKWDHSVKWDVPVYGKKHLSAHVVEIDLSKDTNTYLLGHKINGKVIFPGAGYITMVWKTFANIKNVDFEQLSVVLENVWFDRATIMQTGRKIKFLINIKETGVFKIYESDMVVASGSIRESDASEKDQLRMSLTVSSDSKNLLPLDTKDVYKELGLRGYEYSGIFQGIKSSNNHATVGELHWFNHWTSFIDTIFQFRTLSNNRKLVYGSHMERFTIDPIHHGQLISRLVKDDDGLPIYFYKNIDIFKSGGIEVRGFRFTAPQRLQIQPNLRHEHYGFVPYENPCDLAEDPIKGTTHALTILLQIIYENITTLKIKAIEVTGERTEETRLAPLILNILRSEPSFTIDLEVIAAFSDNIVTRDVNSIHLVIAADILSKQSYDVLQNLTNSLKPAGFILLEESVAHIRLFNMKTALKKANLLLVASQTNSIGKIYLLLRKQKDREEQTVIRITEKNFMWLEDVKAALKQSDENSQEVLLVSQEEELLGLIGFVNCIRFETGGANVRYVFIQDKNAPEFHVSTEFYEDQLNKGLTANVLKGGHWGSYRHLPLDEQSNVLTEHAYLNVLTKGNLNSLTWIQSPLKEQWSTISLNTMRCNVYYASISVRDVMLASGKLALDASPGKATMEDPVLGLEFSGRDMDGRRVMGIVKAGGLATTVLADSEFLWQVPDKWTLQEAATIPVAYAISYYALFIRGQLKAGERVLIHASVDGIGQAALSLALHIGCTVFVIVRTSDEREHVKKIFPELADRNIGISRDLSFEQRIFMETQERGVDVMLAEEGLQVNVRCLAVNGRLVGIGNHNSSNFSTPEYSLKNMTFHNIMMEALFEENEKVTKLISEGIKSGAVRPLSSIVFSEQRFKEGFKSFSTDKYAGKILLKLRDEESNKRVPSTRKLVPAVPRTNMNPKKSYIVVGGLGGFGLELTDWLIGRGAKSIVLLSLLNVHTGYQALCLRRWAEKGINIVISTADITTPAGAERLIKESNQLAPVGGIFNLAGVLRDGFIENLKETDFRTVMLPKVNGTKNLDATSRKSCPSLDYFVIFSSIASGRGNIAQSNYGLANSAMERIIERRRATGFPGLAIQWAPIGDTGMYINTVGDNDTVRNGIIPQRMSSCLTTIDIFLQQPQHQVLCSTALAEKRKHTDDRKDDFVEKMITNILGVKDINSINPDDSFISLGMDSLGYVEIKYTLESKYGIFLSIEDIFSLTLAKLKDLCLSNVKNG
ncbi:Fatty acid synthase [Ooceraea biroi]|nr:Fatty acid synthase [Ooceraea biroi]